jgi:hypothetical protein
LLACLVTGELAEADASGLRKLGLGETEGCASRPDDVREVHIGMMTDVIGIGNLPVPAHRMPEKS